MLMPTHIIAVGGITEDKEGNILLVKTYHGGWVFPGGQVEEGENLIDALTREIKEESGIDFVCTPVSGELCTSEETSDSCWVSRDKALKMIEAPAIRERYQAYLNYNGTVNYTEYVTHPEFELKLKKYI